MNKQSIKQESFSWHVRCWEQLGAYVDSNRVPHALILAGQQGTGKSLLANRFAQQLLCEAPSLDKACNTCRACHLFQVGTHPDFIEITPEEEGKGISVDRIRALGQILSLKSQYPGYRVALINPAHALNRNAANALLKTLEEPGDNTVILLVTHRASALPATILSRCQKMLIPTPGYDEATSWLKKKLPDCDAERLLEISAGSPLKAYALADGDGTNNYAILETAWLELLQGKIDPVSAASTADKLPEGQVIEWLLRWLIELIKFKSGSETSSAIATKTNKILKLSQGSLNFTHLFKLLDKLLEARALLDGQVNRTLMLESLFIDLSKLKNIN